MKFVLKTLLLAPTAKKFYEYKSKFYPVFKGREPVFDELFGLVGEFYKTYDTFPPLDLVRTKLEAAGMTKQLRYVEDALADHSALAYSDEAVFFSALEDAEKMVTVQDVFKIWTATQTKLTSATNAMGLDELSSSVEDMLAETHRIKTRLSRNEASTSSLLYGSQEGSGHTLHEIYDRIVQQKETAGAAYYDLGLSHFDKAKLKDGDLVFFGAFTSHGKSILLRHLAYRQVVYYGRNTAFFSHEMSHDVCRALFALLHANNKTIFPNTPYISSDAWKNGQLTPEEKDFLFNTADHDLRNNPQYGILYIDQPNISKFKLSDLDAKLTELESVFPVRTVVNDYLLLQWPLETDRGQPDVTDFNQMIKGFKNMALTHRNARGEVAPFLALTAAQISRAGLDRALKAEGIYDLAAFERYSEIEKSSDHAFTVLMTPEMRAMKRLRLQHHKNRDGEVIVDPADIFCDLERGFGLSEVQERSATQTAELIKTLQI